jgi:hypothetical protein
MEKISIKSVQAPSGGYSGFVKGNPDVIAVGATAVEMVQNLIQLTKDKNEKK